MSHRSSFSPLPLLLLALCLAALALLPQRVHASAATTPSAGFDSYHIGNSHTLGGDMRIKIKQIATAAGHPHDYSMSCILGASINYIWNNAAGSGGWEGEVYTQGLAANNAWEALSMQVYNEDQNGEAIAAGNFYEMARAGNPNVQCFLYNIWPRHYDFENPPAWRTIEWVEGIADQMQARFPGSTIRIIPAGKMIIRLGQMADAGQIPTLTSRTQLFADEGHLNEIGAYAVAMMHVSCFYKENPVNYTLDPDGSGPTPPFNADLAATIKNVIWDTLINYPRSGLSTNVIIQPETLPRAIAGVPYSQALQAANGTPPFSWSLTSGSLPPGIGFSAGSFSGTPSTAGSYPLTVRVADSQSRVATRTFTFTVEADTAPTVTTTALAAGNRGTFYSQVLAASGGNAPLTWSIASGSLPTGMTLESNGRLRGSPGVTGSFSFTVRAQDSDPQNPESDTQALTLQVNAPTASTLLAPKLNSAYIVDGKLDEPFWTLPTSISKTVQGTPNESAAFQAVWTPDRLIIGIRAYDAINHTDSGANLWDDDAIELFLDGLNDKEVIYNADDRRFVLRRDGQRWVLGDRSQGVVAEIAAISGGHSAEFAIDWRNLNFPNPDNQTLGLDVAIDDDDNGGARDHRRTWQAGATLDDDPSQFGNVVLDTAQLGTATTRPVFLESAGQVVMEAEHYTRESANGSSPRWIAMSAPANGFVGPGFVGTPELASPVRAWSSSPELAYDVQISTPGTYSIWLRRYSATLGDDSCLLGVNGTQLGDSTGAGAGNQWSWSKHSVTVTLAAGIHTLNLRVREDGFWVDRLLMTTSSTFTPGGAGPAQSARALVPLGGTSATTGSSTTGGATTGGSTTGGATTSGATTGSSTTAGSTTGGSTTGGATTGSSTGLSLPAGVALATIATYDSNALTGEGNSNSVDFNASGAPLSSTATTSVIGFRDLVATQFAAGRGGVATLEDYPSSLGQQGSVTHHLVYANGTKALQINGAFRATTMSSDVATSGNLSAVPKTSTLGNDQANLDLTLGPIHGGQANEVVRHFGITVLGRSASVGVTVTAHFNDATTTSLTRTVGSGSAQDTFYGFSAPAGKHITRIVLVTADGTTAKTFDDIAFVTEVLVSSTTGGSTTGGSTTGGSTTGGSTTGGSTTGGSTTGGATTGGSTTGSSTGGTTGGSAITVQSESGTWGDGSGPSSGSGAINNGFVDFGGQNSWAEITANVPAAGLYSIEFRYANGSTGNRSCNVTVNGSAAGSSTFPATGSWTTWNTVTLSNVALNAGNNTIRATASSGSGGPNMDQVRIIP